MIEGVNNNHELGESKDRAQREWEVTVDSLDQVVLMVDSSGNIIRGNRTVETWGLGNVKQLSGFHFHNFFHPDCRAPDCYLIKGWDDAQEKLNRNQPFFIEEKDHVLNRFLSVQFRPISFEKSRLMEDTSISAVLVFEDITQSRLVLNRIKQAASELSSIFQFIPDSYIRLDPSGIIKAYKSGNHSQDFFMDQGSIGKNIQDILPASLKGMFMASIKKARKTNALEVLEYTYHSPGGKQIFEARIVPIFKDHVNIINRDITENKRLISIAETMNQMENLGYIFSGIRHEIGNPINSIKMTVSVLKNNIDRFSKERVMEYIDRVMAEVNRVEYLLKNLKNFNMFEELIPIDISLSDFITKFVDLVKDDLEKKGIKINCRVSPEVDKAYVDPRAFHQALLNIISNSTDALNGVKNPVISILIGKTQEKLWLKIIDNGEGIETSRKADIFKPFFTTKPQGTGLGLNIVQKIVNRMGGTIDIESLKEVGTTVSIYIPERKSGTP